MKNYRLYNNSTNCWHCSQTAKYFVFYWSVWLKTPDPRVRTVSTVSILKRVKRGGRDVLVLVTWSHYYQSWPLKLATHQLYTHVYTFCHDTPTHSLHSMERSCCWFPSCSSRNVSLFSCPAEWGRKKGQMEEAKSRESNEGGTCTEVGKKYEPLLYTLLCVKMEHFSSGFYLNQTVAWSVYILR